MPKQFSLDRLNSVNADKSGHAAVTALNGLEKFRAEEQIAGLTMAFAAVLDKYSASYSDAIRVAQNLFNRAAADTPSVRAVKRYVKEEL